jgi:hypothetical protein
MKSIKFYLPKCLCLLSHWPFVSSFKKFLCHIYRLSLSPCTIPLERYISNFLNDVPAPPPGKVEVTYIIGPDSVVFGRPPSNEPTAWSSHPLSSLFECLSLQNILTIFSALISERQVALISSQYSLLTTCSESILSLLFPLTWTHVYIPILPRRILGLSLSLSLSSFHSLRSLGCSATFPCRSALLLPPRLLSRVLLYGASEQKSKLHGIHPKPVRRLCCLLFRNCSRLSG